MFEVFDLERYFPVTLPLRPPSNVEVRMLDDEEFGDEEVEVDEDEEEPRRRICQARCVRCARGPSHGAR